MLSHGVWPSGPRDGLLLTWDRVQYVVWSLSVALRGTLDLREYHSAHVLARRESFGRCCLAMCTFGERLDHPFRSPDTDAHW
jgi:hypothetical protein